MGQAKKPTIHMLEDYEPGATKEQVLQVLSKIAAQKVESKRATKKRGGQPQQASS